MTLKKIESSTSKQSGVRFLEEVWPAIAAKCWADPDYKERVKADLQGVLKEMGINEPMDE